MRAFGSRGGFGSGEKLDTIVAKVQEIKAAPAHGQKRLVIRENGKTHTHSVVDIDMKCARDLEEQGTYKFEVKAKDAGRPGMPQRNHTSGFRTYECRSDPQKYDAAKEREEAFTRFGKSNLSGKRTKF